MNLFFTLASAILGTLFVSPSIKAEEHHGFCSFSAEFRTVSESYFVDFEAQLYGVDGKEETGLNSKFSGAFSVSLADPSIMDFTIQKYQYIHLKSDLSPGTLPNNAIIDIYSQLSGEGSLLHSSASYQQPIANYCEIDCDYMISATDHAAWQGAQGTVSFYINYVASGTFDGTSDLTLSLSENDIVTAEASENIPSELGLSLQITMGSTNVLYWSIGSYLSTLSFRAHPCDLILPSSSPTGAKMYTSLPNQLSASAATAYSPSFGSGSGSGRP